MLTSLFERCMKRRGVKECDHFDWEKTSETVQPPVTVSVITNNTTPVISRPTCTSYGADINNQLITSTVDNGQEEEPDNKKTTPEVNICYKIFVIKFTVKFFTILNFSC